jgi:hypothetical protein
VHPGRARVSRMTTPDHPAASSTSVAVADLARSVGVALIAFARTIAPADADEDALTRLGLGTRQQEITALNGLRTEEGLAAADVASAIDYDAPNTHTALRSLARRGVLENIHLHGRQRWRLAPAYRPASETD